MRKIDNIYKFKKQFKKFRSRERREKIQESKRRQETEGVPILGKLGTCTVLFLLPVPFKQNTFVSVPVLIGTGTPMLPVPRKADIGRDTQQRKAKRTILPLLRRILF